MITIPSWNNGVPKGLLDSADRVILVLRHADAPGQRRCKVDQILPILRSDKSSVRLPFTPGPPSTRGTSIWRLTAARKEIVRRVIRALAPTLLALSFVTAAHAQGTMDFSGAQTLMGTFNSRFAYVSVSRASHDAQIYTNDAGFLAASLSQDVSKSSAIDFANAQSPTASVELEQVSPLRKTHVAGLGLSL